MASAEGFAYLDEFVVTQPVERLRNLLDALEPGHVLVVGSGGTGKTAAAMYLTRQLRERGRLAVYASLRNLEDGDSLAARISSLFLKELEESKSGRGNRSEEIQLATRIAETKRLSLAFSLLDQMFEVATRNLKLKERVPIFLDDLDENKDPGEVSLAIQRLANELRAARLIVLSRGSLSLTRLQTDRLFETVSLGLFTLEESKRLFTRLISTNIDSPILDEFLARAGGSPVLLKFLASSLRSAGPSETLLDSHITVERAVRNAMERVGRGDTFRQQDALLLMKLTAILEPVQIAQLAAISSLKEVQFREALNSIIDASLCQVQDGILELHDLVSEYVIANYVVPDPIDPANLEFGDEAAERDSLLNATFMAPRDLRAVFIGKKTIVLGDRGSGKSAIFNAIQNREAAWMVDSASVFGDLTDSRRVITALAQNPSDFVQQMKTAETSTLSAEWFKAIWLLYAASLGARAMEETKQSVQTLHKSFFKDSRALLRRVGWMDSIKRQGQWSLALSAALSFLPDKITLKLGPITVEPTLTQLGKTLREGKALRIDEFLDDLNRVLQAINGRFLIVIDQIDELFKYERDKQEALVRGLFLAESFISLKPNIRLAILLRTDLFEVYDIQEKNKFVSRTMRLEWNREALRSLMVQRLFSNGSMRTMLDSLRSPGLKDTALVGAQLRLAFPAEVEGAPFEEWLFEGLRNGRRQVSPRQIILFLNLVKESARKTLERPRYPLFQDNEVTSALTRLSELSYQEVISDFRVATAFVGNCRAAKIRQIQIDKVTSLFDQSEGTVSRQIEQLERLGFLERIVIAQGEELVPLFAIPSLFTRCWQISN
jgi:hypothetical protein